MSIRAVVFDIGGVLEYTPRLGIDEQWEAKLGLEPGTLGQRLIHLWRGGSLGTITLDEVHNGMAEAMDWSAEQVSAYMEDVWREYVGTLNTELAEYFASLRPTYKTGILSNSFVGAREREMAAYHFDQMADVIIYSHEVGLRKPDPRIYELTWQRLGVQPHEMIFLDDHDDMVEPARALGVHGIVFTHNARTIAEIEACLKANAR
jgi:epoxide hydrolase-like predicted phosphatase